jgi:endonuclease G
MMRTAFAFPDRAFKTWARSYQATASATSVCRSSSLAVSHEIRHPAPLLFGFTMRSRSSCLLRVVLVLLVVCASGPAWTETCTSIFAGGQAPVLLNAKLAQRTTILCNNAFAVLASGVTRGPLWSAEHLTARSLADADATARTGRFHDDQRLPPEDRAVLSDYVRSGYDRGHMAPSGDMPNPEAQQQSFSLANIVPQTAQLNRNVWAGIEMAVRHLAQRQGALFVVTGPAFAGSELQSLKGRVLVPTATWKAVYDPIRHGAAAYRCTNVIRPRCVTLSIAALTREISIDPFPAASWLTKHWAMTLPVPEPNRYRARRRNSTTQ